MDKTHWLKSSVTAPTGLLLQGEELAMSITGPSSSRGGDAKNSERADTREQGRQGGKVHESPLRIYTSPCPCSFCFSNSRPHQPLGLSGHPPSAHSSQGHRSPYAKIWTDFYECVSSSFHTVLQMIKMRIKVSCAQRNVSKGDTAVPYLIFKIPNPVIKTFILAQQVMH